MAGGAVNARILAELGAPQMITVVANTPFTIYQFSHTVPQGTQAHLTISGNNEFLINSIRVGSLTGSVSAVPEPASWAMMLTAGLGLGGAKIYRRHRHR